MRSGWFSVFKVFSLSVIQGLTVFSIVCKHYTIDLRGCLPLSCKGNVNYSVDSIPAQRSSNTLPWLRNQYSLRH